MGLKGFPKLSFYANGGFPTVGEIFIARDNLQYLTNIVDKSNNTIIAKRYKSDGTVTGAEKLEHKGLNDEPVVSAKYYKSDYDVKEFNNLYEYDLFIGEEFYLDKGLGKIVISIVNSILFDEKHADGIIYKKRKSLQVL